MSDENLGYIFLGGVVLIFVFLVWFMTRDNTVLDDVLRDRADYDIWLRRNSISEEREKLLQREQEDLTHQKKMNELKSEVDKLENLLKSTKK